MNESGAAVAPLARRYGIQDPEKLIIVHDELDLPPAGLQVKLGGGLAGHKGLRSIQAHLHTDGFVRIWIGIGKPERGSGADHVLHRPGRADRERLDATIALAADAIEVVAGSGLVGRVIAAIRAHDCAGAGYWSLDADDRVGVRLVARGFGWGWRPHWMAIELDDPQVEVLLAA